MKKNVLVSVSSLPAEKTILTYAKEIAPYADFLHCDIMDGTLTPAVSLINSVMVSEINDRTTLPIDVHMMVRSPQNYIAKYAKAGANLISFHYECFIGNEPQLIETIKMVKKLKCLCGIAVDLPTDVANLDSILKYVDVVLVMSVNIGKSGQKFESSALNKVKYLVEKRKELDLHYLIEVDGGINNENSNKIIKAGADIIVSGSYIFNKTNYQLAIQSLKKNSNKK